MGKGKGVSLKRHQRERESSDDLELELTKFGRQLYAPKRREIPKFMVEKRSKYVGFLEAEDPTLQFAAALVLAKLDPDSELGVDEKLLPIFEQQFSDESSLRNLVFLGLDSPHKLPRRIATDRLLTLLPDKLTHGVTHEIKAIVPVLVCLSKLQDEAACVLLQFAFKAMESHRHFLIKQQLVSVLVHLLQNSTCDIRDKAAKALASFVDGCETTAERDHLISLKCPLTFADVYYKGGEITPAFMLNASHILANIYCVETCRASPDKPVVKFLYELLNYHHTDFLVERFVLKFACKTLSCLRIDALDVILDWKGQVFCEKLVELLENRFLSDVTHDTLTIVEHIVGKGDTWLKIFLGTRILSVLGNFLESCMKETMVFYRIEKKNKEMACSIIERFFCIDGSSRVKLVCGDDGAIYKVIKLIEEIKNDELMPPYDKDDLKVQAATTIRMAITHGEVEDISVLLKIGCIETLCDLLVCQAERDDLCQGERIIEACLRGLHTLLDKARVFGLVECVVGRFMDHRGGFKIIESMTCFPKMREVQKLARSWLSKCSPKSNSGIRGESKTETLGGSVEFSEKKRKKKKKKN